MSKKSRIFVSNKTINMNVELKYNEINTTILDNVKEVVLTPIYYGNKFRKNTNYLERLNHTFLGVRREALYGSKYIITAFVQNFRTKEWMRTEYFVDNDYNVIKTEFSHG